MDSNYLFIQAISLFAFAGLYHFVFRKNKRFAENRVFLLSTLLFSILLPLISINAFPYEIQLQNIVSRSSEVIGNGSIEAMGDTTTYDSMTSMTLIYIIGATISLLLFLLQMTKVFLKIRKSDFEKTGGAKIALTNENNSYSFFNYIFLSDRNEIIESHERAHWILKHSIDLMLMRILMIPFWFHPIFYLFNFWIKENHEYQADDYILNRNSITPYQLAEQLVQSSISRKVDTTIYNHFSSLTKNRITMLQQKSPRNPASYLLMIPCVLILFSSFTLKEYPVYVQESIIPFSDTIPGKVLVTDTTIVYDPDNYTETFTVTSTEVPIEDMIRDLEFSGKKILTIDTLVIFDPEYFNESTMVLENTLPSEIYFLMDDAIGDAKESLREHYVSSKVLSYSWGEKDKAHWELELFKEHDGFTFVVYNEAGDSFKKVEVPANEKIEVSQLDLKKGRYFGRTSNDINEVTLIVN